MTSIHAAPTRTQPPAPHAVPRARRANPTVSVVVSVVLHALALFLCTLVVYRTTVAPTSAAPDVTVSFDAPGYAEHSSSFQTIGSTARAGSASRPRALSGLGEITLIGAPAGPATNPGTDTSAPATGVSEAALAPVLGISNAKLLAALTGLRTAAVSSGFGATYEGSLAGSTGAFAAAPGDGDLPAGVTFAGLGASTARSVVYAVDCSGPMVTTLPMVLDEVRRSVARLAPTQRFSVVLFSSRDSKPAIESFAPTLVRATPSARLRLDEWLAAADTAGRSSPLAGLEAALALKPDAVFLLSRSIERSGGGVWELGLQATLQRLDALNPPTAPGKRAVLIQTIQFIDDDPTGILQAIALAHGGGTKGYRVIKRAEEVSQ